ncbi:MAG: helix-turn-helix domain-containing protein [Rectinemataceae bacterium]|nr:helix-turn-helix domain-containing protein [Rectinemataceae bacterium]
MDRPTGAARDLFRKYIVANLLILLLPTLVAFVFYAFSARTIRNDIDELARSQLLASLATVDRQLVDIQKVAAQFAIDYEINFYLNNPGPFSAVETYNLKRISEKLSSFVLGNDLLSHCFLYFANPDIVAYDSGFSDFKSFFGPVFSAEGYDRDTFRRVILTGSVDETIYTRMDTSFSGLKSQSHLAVRPIGYGAYNRGALIGVMEGRNLNRLLLGLPEKYGGWVAIYNRDGSLVAATDPEAERLAYREGPAGAGSIGRARIDRETYRTYRAHSQISGWDYVAALNEKKILADTRSVRDAALLILGFGFLGGCAVSYWFAYSHSKPLGKLFGLLIGESPLQDETDTSIYEKVEKAIAGLSDSRSILEDEVRQAKGIARADFFRRLFDGAYRDRDSFAREVARLDIDLASGGSRFVVLCRISAPGYAENPVAPFSVTEAVLADASQPDAGLSDGKKLLGMGEYLVALSFGETAFILLATDRDRASVSRLADALRSAASPGFQGTIAFGAGDPVQDPFLLQLSFAQAETALRRPAASGPGREVFYADLPVPAGGFLYPLDVEESVMRAVRSANRELFDSLFDSLSRSNFEERVLTAQETRDLGAALRGTALRLLPEHPAISGALRERLYAAPDSAPGNDPLGTVRTVFVDMIETGEVSKKSHNRKLSAQARDYIVANYADPGMGLALVARELGMSENYLSNLYKEQTGECISETIESVRMEEARTLLSGSDLSVDLVAGRTGYQVPSFRRAFKRVTGMSPSDFRKRSSE